MSALDRLKQFVAPAVMMAGLMVSMTVPETAQAQSYQARKCEQMGGNIGRAAGAYAAYGKREAAQLATILGQVLGQVTGNAMCDEPVAQNNTRVVRDVRQEETSRRYPSGRPYR